MEDNEMIVGIISTVAPSIVTIVTLLITFFRDSVIMRRTAAKERIDRLYLPFYHYCILIQYPQRAFSDFDGDIQGKIDVDLLSGIDCASPKCQLLYFEFSRALVRYKANRTVDNKAKLDEAFKSVAVRLIREYSLLCRKTKQPRPPRLSQL